MLLIFILKIENCKEKYWINSANNIKKLVHKTDYEKCAVHTFHNLYYAQQFRKGMNPHSK